MTDVQKRIILELAKQDMKMLRVAREMGYNVNTVDYHLKRVHAETGLNPKRFYDLAELLMIINGGE